MVYIRNSHEARCPNEELCRFRTCSIVGDSTKSYVTPNWDVEPQ